MCVLSHLGLKVGAMLRCGNQSPWSSAIIKGGWLHCMVDIH